jgi:hypothetical protein
MEFHKSKYTISKKLANSARGHIDWIERREEVVKEKNEKKRLKALWKYDIDEYLKLINHTKNTRLIEILQ